MAQAYISRVRPTVTAGLYDANDVVGGLLTFQGLPPRGIIRAVKVVDQAAQAGAYQLVLFDTSPTAIADGGANDIADADLLNVIAAIHLTDTAGADSFSFADNKAYFRQGLILPYQKAAADIYGFLIAKGTPTYAATTDVQIQLHVEGVGA